MARTRDGSELLTGSEAGGLLRSAVAEAGGVLASWSLDHVEHRPGRSTTALYRTRVTWPQLDGPGAPPREELFGASTHIGEPERKITGEDRSLLLTDGDITARVWRYPHDPWLPMLARVCCPETVGAALAGLGVTVGAPPGAVLPVEVLSYRPGRRAVLRVDLPDAPVFCKVMAPGRGTEVVQRHEHLLAAQIPVPRVLAHRDGLVVLAALPGRPLARAVLSEGADACRPEELVALLDRLPASLHALPPRPPWADAAEFYARVIGTALPALAPRLDALVRAIRTGLAQVATRIGAHPHDVVHGDFYEAQVFVEGGHVTGLLDVDTAGPGRRADDLACMLAHLSVLADPRSSSAEEAERARVAAAIERWGSVLGERVDAQEMCLRAAGVVLSLATGPHRQQEESWEAATEAIVAVAERWASLSPGTYLPAPPPVPSSVPC